VKAAIPLMPMSVEDQHLLTLATQNEDDKMGFKPFVDVTSEVIQDGTHPIGAKDKDTPTSDDESPEDEEE